MRSIEALSYTKEDIQRLIDAYGKSAVLYERDCPYCDRPFKVRAYTAISQFKKYNKFVAPGQCKSCFEHIRAITTPSPPANLLEENCTKETPVSPKILIPVIASSVLGVSYLENYRFWEKRSKLEGKTVTLSFTEEMNADPVCGFCVAFSPYGICITPTGVDPAFSLFYLHSTVKEVVLLSTDLEAISI